MLPQANTNKYGDLLKEFYTGIKDGSLSETRMNEIQRIFNEFWQRERQYNTLLEPRGRRFIDTLHLGVGGIEPDKGVLNVFVGEKINHPTDFPVTNATFTYVTFNRRKYGDNFAFQLDATDNQRIYIRTKAKVFFCTLAHAWEANSTGVRRSDFEYYDSQGTLLGTALESVLPAGGGEDNWYTNVRLADLPDTADYIKCRVKQTSGGTLHLTYFAVDLHIA